MVLIGLLYKHFIDNLYNFPNHVICVSKKTVLNIKTIHFNHEYSKVNLTRTSRIDLSKLVILYIHNGDSEDRRESVKIHLEGLASLERLHLGANSTEMYFSIRNLNSLNMLSLYIRFSIDENIIKQLDQVRHIEKLYLYGNFSYFNLDHFANLKLFFLTGTLNESFNIDLFKNLCNRIMSLKIELTNIEEKTFFKLFNDHNFPSLISFCIMKCNIKQLKKENFNQFPYLNFLYIIDCNLEVIEHDVFSNLKHLRCLDLSQNRLKSIENNTFSDLKNLETLDLSSNELKNLDAKFIEVGNSAEILLENKSLATFNRYWYSD